MRLFLWLKADAFNAFRQSPHDKTLRGKCNAGNIEQPHKVSLKAHEVVHKKKRFPLLESNCVLHVEKLLSIHLHHSTTVEAVPVLNFDSRVHLQKQRFLSCFLFRSCFFFAFTTCLCLPTSCFMHCWQLHTLTYYCQPRAHVCVCLPLFPA